MSVQATGQMSVQTTCQISVQTKGQMSVQTTCQMSVQTTDQMSVQTTNILRTRVGPGYRDRTLAVKSQKKSAFVPISKYAQKEKVENKLLSPTTGGALKPPIILQ